MEDIKSVIAQRQSVHGDWADNARLTQAFKAIIRSEVQQRAARGQQPMTDMMIDALEMISHKMGRILSGNAAEEEHWLDIEGYARITRERLVPKEPLPDWAKKEAAQALARAADRERLAAEERMRAEVEEKRAQDRSDRQRQEFLSKVKP